jgi:hypothetical protein
MASIICLYNEIHTLYFFFTPETGLNKKKKTESDHKNFETGDTQQSNMHFPSSCYTFRHLFNVKLECTDIQLALITFGSRY